jgi:phospholipase/carboxylesterase
MSLQSNKHLLIFLHGVGSNGANLAPLADVWETQLPDTAYAAPNAPFPFDHGMGYQWFSITGVTAETRPHRLVEARPAFDALITSMIAQHGFSQRLDQVAFIGFSQGSIMALDAVMSGRWPVRCVVAFSGRLSTPSPFTPSMNARILLTHGDADLIIPHAETTHAYAAIEAAGMEAECHILPGVGHSISPDAAKMAGSFLANCFR